MSRDGLGFISTKFQPKWNIQGRFWTNLRFWDFSGAQPGLGTWLILDQGHGSAWTRDGAQLGPGTVLFGAHLGPIWGPILRDPFRGIGRGPGTHLEAEGRHFGGRRPTKWGSGGGAPREKTSFFPQGRTAPR